jgi:hypothetical protein
LLRREAVYSEIQGMQMHGGDEECKQGVGEKATRDHYEDLHIGGSVIIM